MPTTARTVHCKLSTYLHWYVVKHVCMYKRPARLGVVDGVTVTPLWICTLRQTLEYPLSTHYLVPMYILHAGPALVDLVAVIGTGFLKLESGDGRVGWTL